MDYTLNVKAVEFNGQVVAVERGIYQDLAKNETLNKIGDMILSETHDIELTLNQDADDRESYAESCISRGKNERGIAAQEQAKFSRTAAEFYKKNKGQFNLITVQSWFYDGE